MTTLGVFRDDYYNSMAALSQNQFTTYSTAGAYTIPAASMAGAQEVYFASTAPGGAVNYTTDTAANIVARLQNAVLAQLQATGFLSQAGAVAPGVPNLYNVSYYLDIINPNAGGTITLVAGTGVTITGTATIAAQTSRGFLVTVTGPTSVTIQNIGAGGV
jgi:hypothetical protein